MVYIQGNSVPQANINVLKKLICARNELAQVYFFMAPSNPNEAFVWNHIITFCIFSICTLKTV